MTLAGLRLASVLCLFTSLRCAAHVPTYEAGCVDGCCVPPRQHDTSQVVYLKGSGGLEIHIESLSQPFALAGADPKATALDFDVVFRDPVDASTFTLYVGCGGCAPSDEVRSPAVPFRRGDYEPGVLEPFTQTRYFSLFPKNERTFTAGQLTECFQLQPEDAHWSIRLVDHANRSSSSSSSGGSDPLVWGAVVGLGERFTAQELIEFPIYILNNHGSAWNEAAWTWWVCLFLLAPLLFESLRVFARRRLAQDRHLREEERAEATARLVLLFDVHGQRSLPCVAPSLRCRPLLFLALEWLYAAAEVGFLAAMLEESVHLFYSQAFVPLGHELAVGLFLVILLPNGLMLLAARRQRAVFSLGGEMRGWRACVVFARLFYCGRCCSGPEWPRTRSAGGLVFAAALSVGAFFFFGAGFYLGPSALLLALLLHAVSLSLHAKEAASRKVQKICTTYPSVFI